MRTTGTRVTRFRPTRNCWSPVLSVIALRLRNTLFMPEGKRKVLLVSSQPIQNAATLRLMAVHPDFEVLTAYCSLADARLWRDDEHLNKEVFDTPALDGYNWVRLANWSPLPQLG